MGSKIPNIEVLFIYFLLLIPWPPTHVIKLFCSKDNSRLVRKIVRSKWTPILDKYQVNLPLECPLHPLRDLFAPRQDAKKRDRPTQWTCRLCGKSFYQEKFLDLHFENRHKNTINEAEEAVCLADFCDIMRCDVFQTEESSSLQIGDQHVSTDIEVWGDSFSQNSALAKANVAYFSLLPIRSSSLGASRASKVQIRQLCQEQISQNKFQQTDNSYVNNGAVMRKSPYGESGSSTVLIQKSNTPSIPASKQTDNQSDSPEEATQNSSHSNNDSTSNNTVKSDTLESNQNSSGDNQNGSHKLRTDCKPDELNKIKNKCEYLIRSCIGGLILQMTEKSYNEMEDEMNKAVCWYLTCERYWEDGPLERRAFPWILILILIFVLSIGICFCYYIIWILFDSEEATIYGSSQHLQQSRLPNTKDHYHYQEFPGMEVQQGLRNVESMGGSQYCYQPHQAPSSRHQLACDVYPESLLYDCRQSPRRYAGEVRPSDATTTMMITSMSASVTQTPQRQFPATSMAYQQNLLDRYSYMNRAKSSGVSVSNTSANIGPNSTLPTTAHHVTLLNGDRSQLNYNLNANTPSGSTGGGYKHYNTIPRPFETRQRYVSGSQQSLRTTMTQDIVQNEVAPNDHYIYVTYPPDLNKRILDKYE